MFRKKASKRRTALPDEDEESSQNEALESVLNPSEKSKSDPRSKVARKRERKKEKEQKKGKEDAVKRYAAMDLDEDEEEWQHEVANLANVDLGTAPAKSFERKDGILEDVYSTEMIEQLKKASVRMKRIVEMEGETNEGNPVGHGRIELGVESDTEEKPLKLKEKANMFRKSHAMAKRQEEREMGGNDSEEDLEWERQLLRRSGAFKNESETLDSIKSDRLLRKGRNLSEMIGSWRRILAEKQKFIEDSTRQSTMKAEEVKALRKEIQQKGIDLDRASKLYDTMQELYQFVQGLRSCLITKSPMIEEVKVALKNLDQETRVSFDKNRFMFVGDLIAEARGLGISVEIGDAGAFPALVMNRQESDEYGRDLSHVYKLKFDAETQTFGSLLSNPIILHSSQPLLDGFRTISQEIRRTDILKAVGLIFVDVDDMHASPSNWLARFREWEEKFPEQYKTAFVDLALPGLIAPYFQLELCRWDIWKSLTVTEDNEQNNLMTKEGVEVFPLLATFADKPGWQQTLTAKVLVPHLRSVVEDQYTSFGVNQTKLILACSNTLAKHELVNMEVVSNQIVKCLIDRVLRDADSMALPLLGPEVREVSDNDFLEGWRVRAIVSMVLSLQLMQSISTIIKFWSKDYTLVGALENLKASFSSIESRMKALARNLKSLELAKLDPLLPLIERALESHDVITS